MERTKVFRAVRIGTASLCLLASVATIGLWARSYSWKDDVYVFDAIEYGSLFSSSRGTLWAYFTTAKTSHPRGTVRVSARQGRSYIPSQATRGFQFEFKGELIRITLPHWFVALAMGGMGLMLLRGRFTIRLLFIVTAMLAVTLGLMVHR